MSPATASICAVTMSADNIETSVTPCVFCAVTAVIALVPYTPSAANVLRSAWMPAPAPESLPAMVRTARIDRSRGRRASRGLLAEDQQEDERRNRLAGQQAQPGRIRGGDDFFGRHAILRLGPRTATARQEIDDAEATLRCERPCGVGEERDDVFWLLRFVHLAIAERDQHRVELPRQTRIGWRTKKRFDPRQICTGHPPADEVYHHRLNVLCVNDAVRTDAACQ